MHLGKRNGLQGLQEEAGGAIMNGYVVLTILGVCGVLFLCFLPEDKPTK